MPRRLIVLLVGSLLVACSERATAPQTSKKTQRPSQSVADAKRDGVPLVVAALPLKRRIGNTTTVASNGEVWVASRLPLAGVDRTEFEPVEYGEILLLNVKRTRIMKAFPLSGVPAQYLVLRDDALYCGRAGDGALPHSMVCRIDRVTRRLTVRIYGPPDPPLRTEGRKGTWTSAGEYLEMYDFKVNEAGIWAQEFDRRKWTRLDLESLEIVERNTNGPRG